MAAIMNQASCQIAGLQHYESYRVYRTNASWRFEGTEGELRY